MSIELLPCPFCGHEAEIERVGNSRVSTIYQCTNCGCSLETGEEWDHGREWNRREAFNIGAEARAHSWKGVAAYLQEVLEKVADPEHPAVKKVLATYEAQLAADPDDDLPAPASKEGRDNE